MIKRIKEIKNNIITVFDKYLSDNYLLFLFGSAAEHIADYSSDIDLAFYSDKNIEPSTIIKIKEELENKSGTLRQIDLVNLGGKNINKQLLNNILKESKLWKKPRNSEELLKNLRRHLESL